MLCVGNLGTNSPKRAAQLRKAIEKLGPAYVKVAQAVSTRGDVLDVNYLREIERLQDRVPPFPTKAALLVMTEGQCSAFADICADLPGNNQPVIQHTLHAYIWLALIMLGHALATCCHCMEWPVCVCLDLMTSPACGVALSHCACLHVLSQCCLQPSPGGGEGLFCQDSVCNPGGFCNPEGFFVMLGCLGNGMCTFLFITCDSSR